MGNKNYARKQEVIELLKCGGNILCRKNESFGSKGQTIYYSWSYYISLNGIDRPVHHSSITSLQRQNIILNTSPYTYLSENKQS